MYAPLFAIFGLLVLFYVVLRPSRDEDDNDAGARVRAARPTRAQRLAAEAFEFAPADAAVAAAASVLVLYATEYGFAKEVARRAAGVLAAARGGALRVRVLNVVDYVCADFEREDAVLLVASTTGDGVAPHESAELREALGGGGVRFAEGLVYGVLALGDRAYPHFCRGGRLIKEALEGAVGAAPAVEMGEIDQEDWDAVLDWVAKFEAAVPETGDVAACGEDDYLVRAVEKHGFGFDESALRYTRTEPYMARVLSKETLTDSKASEGKVVVRVEFDVADSGLTWTIGDALGVVPRNSPEDVERMLRGLAFVGNEPVVLSGASSGVVTSGPEILAAMAPPVSIYDAMADHLDLKTVRAELIDALGVATDDPSERQLAAELLEAAPGTTVGATAHLSQKGKHYVAERHVLDVLGDFVGASLTPGEVARLLRPLSARYYSISSSHITSPDRIAITVDVLRYVSNSTEREGVASSYLNDRVSILTEDRVGIFVSRNEDFRLPVDSSKPIVMIGPGTGIAPFIGFVDERIAENATGHNLLFFGCRHEAGDFLYCKRLRGAVATGDLDLETAFSRDQPEKVYVQDRLRDRSVDVWRMINNEGAHVYVCGDGARMASDVDQALRDIVQEHGEMGTEEADLYVAALAGANRLQKDVWVA